MSKQTNNQQTEIMPADLTPAEQFFFEHAGYSYDPKTETELIGRIRCARELARAEAYAKANNWEFVWQIDSDADPNDWDGDGPIGEKAYYCQLIVRRVQWEHDGEIRQSLGANWDPTPEDRRVIQAELASEELGQIEKAQKADETRSALLALLKTRLKESTYALDMDTARMFAELTGRPETEVLSVIRNGIDWYGVRGTGGKGKYERAVRISCEDLVQFYESAGEYVITDLVGFIASHDPICVYGVLVGKGGKV